MSRTGYLLVLIALIGLSIWFFSPHGCPQPAAERTAAEMKMIECALEAYRCDNGTYPTWTTLGANNLGGFLRKYAPSWPFSRCNGTTWVDPFGMPYNYRYPSSINTGNLPKGGSGFYDLWSCGPNRLDEKGGGDDIASWKQ